MTGRTWTLIEHIFQALKAQTQEHRHAWFTDYLAKNPNAAEHSWLKRFSAMLRADDTHTELLHDAAAGPAGHGTLDIDVEPNQVPRARNSIEIAPGDPKDLDPEFPFGHRVAGRYKMISFQDAGAMGRVYKAYDEKLKNYVALKLITRSVDDESVSSEVRIGISITHQNVCRLRDIVEDRGRKFIVMNYVSGQTIADGLRMCGRFSVDKAVKICRGICAGVSALHQKGIVHRDLKPANIMIDDATGTPVVLDLGLSVFARNAPSEFAGTPAYMAPEQLHASAAPASTATDIYALGTVFYEIFSGELPFRSRDEKCRIGSRPRPLIYAVPEMPEDIDRVISSCLQHDPTKRPCSVADISRAFPHPGGAANLVRATLSRQHVADIPVAVELSRKQVSCWLLLFLLGLIGLFAMFPFCAPLSKSPDALVEDVHQLLRRFGYNPGAHEPYYWLQPNSAMLHYRAEQNPPEPVRTLGSAEEGDEVLYYQEGEPAVSARLRERGLVPFRSIPENVGQISMEIDSRGALLYFHVTPSPLPGALASGTVDWTTLLSVAGCDPMLLRRSVPRRLPLTRHDVICAWDGSFPGHPNTPVHVVAGATAGRLSYFELIAPWNTGPWFHPVAADFPDIGLLWFRDANLARSTATLVVCLLFIAGVYLVRGNVQNRRGDFKGALVISVCVFVCDFYAFLFGAHFSHRTAVLLSNAFSAFGRSLFLAACVWLGYVALEPYARRYQPRLIVSWARVLSGRFRDNVVTRDVLAGCSFGVAQSFVLQAATLPAWFQIRHVTPHGIGDAFNTHVFAGMAAMLAGATFNALGGLMLFVLCRALLDRCFRNVAARWLQVASATLTGIVFTAVATSGENYFDLLASIVIAVTQIILLLRYGLLAFATSLFVFFLHLAIPHAIDPERWDFTDSLIGTTASAALVAFAIYNWLRGTRSFRHPPVLE